MGGGTRGRPTGKPGDGGCWREAHHRLRQPRPRRTAAASGGSPERCRHAVDAVGAAWGMGANRQRMLGAAGMRARAGGWGKWLLSAMSRRQLTLSLIMVQMTLQLHNQERAWSGVSGRQARKHGMGCGRRGTATRAPPTPTGAMAAGRMHHAPPSNAHRVISSPSRSTTGLATLILCTCTPLVPLTPLAVPLAPPLPANAACSGRSAAGEAIHPLGSMHAARTTL